VCLLPNGTGTQSVVAIFNTSNPAAAGATYTYLIQDASQSALMMNYGTTGNKTAAINFIGDSTYTAYGLRMIRDSTGANAASSINHRGTGSLWLSCTEAGYIQFSTTSITRMQVCPVNSSINIHGLGSTNATYGIAVYTAGGGTLNFYIRDDGVGYLRAAAWSYSDENGKENIAEIEKTGSLAKVLSLKPTKFDYINGQKDCLGFVAQDVQAIIPEAVQEMMIDSIMTVDGKPGDPVMGLAMNYTYIIPYLVNAIKELSDKVDLLDQTS
jgi:hypothetical protein